MYLALSRAPAATIRVRSVANLRAHAQVTPFYQVRTTREPVTRQTVTARLPAARASLVG